MHDKMHTVLFTDEHRVILYTHYVPRRRLPFLFFPKQNVMEAFHGTLSDILSVAVMFMML